jgi:hypothetical protein
MKLKTTYSEYDVSLSWGNYSNGRKALRLIDQEDGLPVMTATVNVPEAELTEKEIIVKNYSENEGVLEFLQENGIVGPVKRMLGVGFPVVELL